jgi:hypothetical protein
MAKKAVKKHRSAKRSRKTIPASKTQTHKRDHMEVAADSNKEQQVTHNPETESLVTAPASAGEPSMSVYNLAATSIATAPAKVGVIDPLPSLASAPATRAERARSKVKDPRRSREVLKHAEFLEKKFPHGRPDLKMRDIHEAARKMYLAQGKKEKDIPSPAATSRAASLLWDSD